MTKDPSIPTGQTPSGDRYRTPAASEMETGRHLILEHELHKTKSRLDDELMRFGVIRAYITGALQAQDEAAFFSLTLEALIEAFELEVALFLRPADEPGCVTVAAAFGIDDPPARLPLRLDGLKPETSEIWAPGSDHLALWPDLDLHQAIACPLAAAEGGAAALIVVGITSGSVDYYPAISADMVSAFTVLVQQAAALWNNRQLTAEIVLKNQKLVQETGQLLIMQRDLVNAKDRIDDELGRFQAIQSYIMRALDAETEEQFFAITLEAVVEAFEFEVALLVSLDQTADGLQVIDQFGFDALPPVLPYEEHWFAQKQAQIIGPGGALLEAWSAARLHQIILCPFMDKTDSIAGAIIAGTTTENADYFDPISDAQTSAYSVMVQAAGALWMTRKLNDRIQRRNAQLVSLTRSYSRFVPFEFLDLLEKKSIEDIEAGANASIDMSVLFLDIRGFTALTEKLGPADTFTWLNRFLAEMEPIIAAQKGFINQFQGDAIMALFPGAADAALGCASGMIAATEAFNRAQQQRREMQISFGLGINSGPVMLGAIGGANRLESNIVGDAANLAARTEGLTKIYGVAAIFTEFTLDRVADPEGLLFRELDRVTVHGRDGAVTIYELLPEQAKTQAGLAAALDCFAEGLQLYRRGEFAAAGEAFHEARRLRPGDQAAAVFVQRCAQLQQDPPGDWTGVSKIAQK